MLSNADTVKYNINYKYEKLIKLVTDLITEYDEADKQDIESEIISLLNTDDTFLSLLFDKNKHFYLENKDNYFTYNDYGKVVITNDKDAIECSKIVFLISYYITLSSILNEDQLTNIVDQADFRLFISYIEYANQIHSFIYNTLKFTNHPSYEIDFNKHYVQLDLLSETELKQLYYSCLALRHHFANISCFEELKEEYTKDFSTNELIALDKTFIEVEYAYSSRFLDNTKKRK